MADSFPIDAIMEALGLICTLMREDEMTSFLSAMIGGLNGVEILAERESGAGAELKKMWLADIVRFSSEEQRSKSDNDESLKTLCRSLGIPNFGDTPSGNAARTYAKYRTKVLLSWQNKLPFPVHGGAKEMQSCRRCIFTETRAILNEISPTDAQAVEPRLQRILELNPGNGTDLREFAKADFKQLNAERGSPLSGDFFN